MLVGIRATFKDRFSAKQAYNEMIKKAHNKESIEIISRTDVKSTQEESIKFKTNWFNVFKNGIAGSFIGIILGIILFLLIVTPDQSLEVTESLKYSFPILGFILGLLLATLFTFISRENTIELSEVDIKNQKAIISAKVNKDQLNLFESILRKYHAQDIYVA